MLVTFNWLKEFVNIRLTPKALADKLTMAGLEVESITKAGSDYVFDISPTPNRGDCLSVIGIAREISAITGAPLKNKSTQFKFKPEGKMRDFITVNLKDRIRCPRYAARIINGIKIAPSPKWLVERLEACGIRSINNVVDATNYMLLETGQPFHAFDWKDLRGYKIIIKTSKDPIDFVTLDAEKRNVLPQDLLICDEDGPVAIGGVMGGANSEVKPDTKTIVLESAYFNPTSIRRTSKRLGLSSESSRRFEKGIDPQAVVKNLNKLTRLILNIAGGKTTTDYIDIYPEPVKPKKINLSVDETNNLLGMNIKPDVAKKHLRNLGITIAKTNIRSASKSSLCVIPTWRSDLTRPVDLIEEIARLEGYEKIPTTTPSFFMSSVSKPGRFAVDNKARIYLSARGFSEAINLGFGSPTDIEPFEDGSSVKITNPLGAETSIMRPSLIPGLLNNIKLNVNHGQESIKLFELRPVFKKTKGEIEEPNRLSGVVYGSRAPLSWTAKTESVDFHDLKGVCEKLSSYIGIRDIKFKADTKFTFLHPEASAIILHKGNKIGILGMLHPEIIAKWGLEGSVGVFELNWDRWCSLSTGTTKVFRTISRQPSVRRDVALLIPENVTSDDVVNTIKNHKNSLINKAFPFDIYKGKGIEPGKKSAAFAVMYLHPERTLTNEEVNEAHDKLVGFIKDKLGAVVR